MTTIADRPTNATEFASWLVQTPTHTLASRGRFTRDALEPEQLHRSVMGLFGQLDGDRRTRRAGAGVLWRQEPAPHAGAPSTILIRSTIPPRPDHGIEQLRQRTEQLDAVATGRQYRFRVAVNAVHRLRGGGTRPVEDVESWLQAKLHPAATEVSVVLHHRDVARGQRHGANAPLQVDRLDGVLTVADPAALAGLLRDGIGRAKAYGVGLLTLAG